ncbi:MAG: dipeptidase PepV [Clostridia bacterium]|nr:dipeptidase PepV [Clostridia bacterium]
MLDKYIDELKNEIIDSTCGLIQIPSVYSSEDQDKYPFGKYTVDALEYVLNLGKEFGFRTKNIDNKCGYVEFGEGEKLLGIIGHLDIVPVTDDWSYPPFNPKIINGKIYGRGTLDDKGPVIAALYAMKAISDNYSLDKRVRLILGLDEERNWECINRYKQTEEMPNISFSPDANFPCIYSEKTISSVYLSQDYISSNDIIIEEINTNNNAINVVPKYCYCKLKINTFNLNSNDIITFLNSEISKNDFNIKINCLDDTHIELHSFGTAAHAARPHLGKNAISKLIIVLNELFKKHNIKLELLEYFSKYIGDDYTGKSLKINFKDDSGILTLNTARFYLENNKLYIGINLRIPVSVNIEKLKSIFNNSKGFYKINIEFTDYKKPLFVQKNDKLVQKLCKIFNDYNNSNIEPEAIGGGTYARAFTNCVSFGPKMPNAEDLCHQVDEYISVDNLMFCAKVYARAILEL